MAKNKDIELKDLDLKENVDVKLSAEDKEKLLRTTTVVELNKIVVLPYCEYDCVIYSNTIPIDVAASRAYYVLKSGGEFIVSQKADIGNWMDVILSLFDIKETNDDSIIFVKVG